MLFSLGTQSKNISIKLGNVEIKQVKDTKFLGLWLDEKLNWDWHVSHVKTKIASGLYALHTHKRLMLYYALINSHI